MPNLSLQDLREALKTVASVAALFFTFTTVAFAAYHIPSESMVPTLQVGDRILVSKFAYGYSRFSLPLGIGEFLPSGGRLFGGLPERGDIAVFVHPRSGEIYIKRVIGLPGDVIELKDGRLYVNGAEAAREPVRDYTYREYNRGNPVRVHEFREFLPGGADHEIIERGDAYDSDNYDPETVPEGHLFMMGDNRDNSTDSRVPPSRRGVGFVPVENLVGRAEIIPFSFAQCAELDDAACSFRALTIPR